MQGFVRGVSRVIYCSQSCAWREGDQVIEYVRKENLKPTDLANRCLACGRLLGEIPAEGEVEKKPAGSETNPSPSKAKTANGNVEPL